jgi:branched-chain amino acid transport system permease protein
MADGYQDEIAFLGRGLSEVIPYIALLLVLLWRPSGVFGSREVSRV